MRTSPSIFLTKKDRIFSDVFLRSYPLYAVFVQRVRRGHGKPGKSWNLRISFSRPGKSWNSIVGPRKSWRIKDLFDR